MTSKPYRVVLLTNPWYECLEDTARLLALGLGCKVLLARPDLYADSRKYRDIILGLHASPQVRIPSNSIIYQTEHPSTWAPSYAVQLQAHETWTYSRHAKGLLTSIKHVPLGYSPDFPRIVPTAEQDIDVLFFGSLNDRRVSVLNEMTIRHRLRVYSAPLGTFGTELTQLIARAKVVLNVHYYTAPACFEYARVVPLVHSGVCVLSEISEQGEGTGLAATASYENLANAAKALVENKELREHCAKQSLKNLMKRPMADILKEVTCESRQ